MKLGGWIVLSLVSVAACGGGDGGGGSSTVEGRVVKGTLSGALVDVWAIGDNGAPQRKLGTTTTDTVGSFSLPVTDYAGWALVTVSGGNYTDEATGSPATIPAATPLMGVALAGNSGNSYVISPITSVLAVLAQDLARDPGVTFADGVENAALAVGLLFGVENAHMTVPADLTAGPASPGPAAHYGAVLAGYSEMAFNLSVSGAELSYAAARDFKDGLLDGLEYQDTIEISPSISLGANFLGRLGLSATAWMDLNPNDSSGLGSADLPGLASLVTFGDMVPKGPRVQAVWNGHSTLAGGSQFEVRGWGFGTNPLVTVDGVAANVLSSDDASITAETPALSAAGDYDLKVTANFGLSYTSRFALRYFNENAAPVVDSVEPAEGPRCGGTPVTIKGRNFGLGTQVFFGATPAFIMNATYPREIVVSSPKATAAGTTDLRIDNGPAADLTLSAAYRYKDKDIGRTYDQTDFDQTFTTIFTKPRFNAGAFELNAGTVQMNFDGAGQGTFTRDEMTVTGTATTETTASGGLFYSPSGNDITVASFDTGNNNSNFYLGFVHPFTKEFSGLTAGGSFYAYPHGTGLGKATLSGEYGVSMSLYKLTPSLSFTTYNGTLEFDGNGYGGMSLKGFERDGEDSGFRQETIVAPFIYDVSPDGRLDLTLNPDEAIPWDFTGRVTPGGNITGGYYAGTGGWQGRVASFVSVKLGVGVAPEDLRGEYGGGFLRQTTFDDDGFDTEIQVKLEDMLLETIAGASRTFTSYDGVRVRAAFTDEEILQRGDVRSFVLGQRGRLEDEGGALQGYVAPSFGYLIRSGRIADSAAFDDNFTFGGAVKVPTYYSKYSLDGLHYVANVKSYWVNPTTPITGDEVNETSLGTVTFNPSKAVTIGGDPYTAFGGFDGLSLTRKAVTRTALSASVSFGPYPDLEADWAYGFLNNRFRLVLAERTLTSPLAGFRPGFVEGTGLMSPTGSFLGFTSNAKSGSTSFTALAPARTSLTLGASYRFGSSYFDFNSVGGATLGRMERGTFSVSGSSILQNYFNRTFTEGGSPTTTSGSRSGPFTVNSNGTLDFLLNGQLLGGFAVGDNADFLVLTDFSSTNQTGVFLAARQSASAPMIFDYGLSFFGKEFVGLTVPSVTQVIQGAGSYTPAKNLISYTSLLQLRSNLSTQVGLGRDFNTGTASAGATGAFSSNLGTDLWTGGLTGDGCFGFALEGADTEAPTAMRIGIFMNF